MAARFVLVLSGNAGHGKDSFAGLLAKRLRALDVPVRLDAYAWTLKQIVHLKCGIPLNILNADKTVKETTFFYGKTVRSILQDEGEHARQTLGRTVWADRLLDRLKAADERVTIVTDARHPNEEIIDIRKRIETECPDTLCFNIRIVRASVPVIHGHPSEDLIFAAPDSLFDFKVRNDGDLKDLQRMADAVANGALLAAQTSRKQLKKKPAGYRAELLLAAAAPSPGWPYPLAEDAGLTGRQVVPIDLCEVLP